MELPESLQILAIFFKQTLKAWVRFVVVQVRMLNKSDLEDYYSEEADIMTRGAALMNSFPHLISQRMSQEVDVVTPVRKLCSRFPQTARAPTRPTDPLYVFTKWCVLCKADVI